MDDKIHARSTGPYLWLRSSLWAVKPNSAASVSARWRFGHWRLTEQPTRSKILTVKSDDVVGRVKTYEAIVKGENIPEPGVPESFRVLIKELQSLALDVRVLGENEQEIEIKEVEEDISEMARELGIDIQGRSTSTSITRSPRPSDKEAEQAGQDDDDEDEEEYVDDEPAADVDEDDDLDVDLADELDGLDDEDFSLDDDLADFSDGDDEADEA